MIGCRNRASPLTPANQKAAKKNQTDWELVLTDSISFHLTALLKHLDFNESDVL